MDQDWNSVTWSRNKPSGKSAREDKLVNEARRKGGDVEVEKKFSAGNRNAGSIVPNAAKLDGDLETFRPKKIGQEFKTALQKERMAKGMTQADLAKLINEKPTVINEYESGKAIPVGAIIQKLNRALGTTLPKSST